MGRRICAHGVLVGRPEERKPLERCRCRWVKMVIQEVGRGGMDRTDVAEDRDRWWVTVKEVWTGLMWLRIGTGGGRV